MWEKTYHLLAWLLSVNNRALNFVATSRIARRLSFSGREWTVKSGNELKPGPNNWSDSVDNVWVDDSGQLHLRITHRNGRWYSAEVAMLQLLGYGRYAFYLASRVDLLDKNVVAGLFVYEDDSNEIDIEFSTWSGLKTNSQYVVQPAPYTDKNLHRFNTQLKGNYSTHRFVWANASISFRSLHGHYLEPPNNSFLIAQWQHEGSHIPQPDAHTIINLWLNRGSPPSDEHEAEIVVTKFEFDAENKDSTQAQ